MMRQMQNREFHFIHVIVNVSAIIAVFQLTYFTAVSMWILQVELKQWLIKFSGCDFSIN